MRGTVDGLATPQPLGHMLPALFHEDDLAQRLTGALDEVLAPVLLVLDNLDAHLLPATAPEDLLVMVAGWLGVEIDQRWPVPKLREVVAGAAESYRRRGTVGGLRDVLEAATGAEVVIDEPGGCVAHPVPGQPLPGSSGDEVVVRVRARVADIDAGVVERIVTRATPAHLRHRVVVGTR